LDLSAKNLVLNEKLDFLKKKTLMFLANDWIVLQKFNFFCQDLDLPDKKNLDFLTKNVDLFAKILILPLKTFSKWAIL